MKKQLLIITTACTLLTSCAANRATAPQSVAFANDTGGEVTELFIDDGPRAEPRPLPQTEARAKPKLTGIPQEEPPQRRRGPDWEREAGEFLNFAAELTYYILVITGKIVSR